MAQSAKLSGVKIGVKSPKGRFFRETSFISTTSSYRSCFDEWSRVNRASTLSRGTYHCCYVLPTAGYWLSTSCSESLMLFTESWCTQVVSAGRLKAWLCFGAPEYRTAMSTDADVPFRSENALMHCKGRYEATRRAKGSQVQNSRYHNRVGGMGQHSQQANAAAWG